MPGKKYKKPTSQKQAALFGAVAGGAVKLPGLSKEEAKGKLKGAKVSKLPKKKRSKKKK